MSETPIDHVACQMCSCMLPRRSILTGAVLRQPVIERMKLDNNAFDENGCVCASCNAKYRAEYLISQ